MEREGWDDVAQLYPETFYKTWLISRMKNWDVLAHVKSAFEEDDTLTCAQMRVKLMKKMSREKEEQHNMSNKLRELTVAYTPCPPIVPASYLSH